MTAIIDLQTEELELIRDQMQEFVTKSKKVHGNKMGIFGAKLMTYSEIRKYYQDLIGQCNEELDARSIVNLSKSNDGGFFSWVSKALSS